MKSKLLVYQDSNSSSVTDFFLLMKPRVMLLVVFSGITGMLLAPGKIHPFIALVSILSMSIGAGSAAAINMWYEIDIDSVMNRTKHRPTVTGKILPEDVLSFGSVLAVFSVFTMAISVNYLSSFLLLFTIAFYVFIYTIWLKRKSTQNIVIGGVAGALPPVIGWTSVTNSISIEPILIFLIIFFWTPPHFWALSLYRAEDYTKAKIPMLPVVKGAEYTKCCILSYTILTALTSLLPYFLGGAGTFYLTSAVILGIYFIYLAVLLLLDQESRLAPKTFRYSLTYLFLICFSLICDRHLIYPIVL